MQSAQRGGRRGAPSRPNKSDANDSKTKERQRQDTHDREEADLHRPLFTPSSLTSQTARPLTQPHAPAEANTSTLSAPTPSYHSNTVETYHLQQENRHLQSRVDTLTRERDSSDKKLSDLKSEQYRMTRENEQLKTQLQTQLPELHTSLQVLMAQERAEQEQKNQKVLNILLEKDETIARLETELMHAQQHIQQAQGQYQELEAYLQEYEPLKQQYQDLQHALQQRERRSDELINERDQYESLYKQSQHTIRMHEEKQGELNEQIDRLKKKTQELEKELVCPHCGVCSS